MHGVVVAVKVHKDKIKEESRKKMLSIFFPRSSQGEQMPEVCSSDRAATGLLLLLLLASKKSIISSGSALTIPKKKSKKIIQLLTECFRGIAFFEKKIPGSFQLHNFMRWISIFLTLTTSTIRIYGSLRLLVSIVICFNNVYT